MGTFWISFNSLKRDILILTSDRGLCLFHRSYQFQFPEAGHFDSYLLVVPIRNTVSSAFQFPEAGHFDSYSGFSTTLNHRFLHYITHCLQLVPNLRTSETEGEKIGKTGIEALDGISMNLFGTRLNSLFLTGS